MVRLTELGQNLWTDTAESYCERKHLEALNTLVSSWHNGDKLAGDQLYSALSGTVQSAVEYYLNRRFRVRVAVEDLVQDVFLDILKKFRRELTLFSSPTALRAWTWRYARHKVCKRISRETAAKRSVDRESRISGDEQLEDCLTDYRNARVKASHHLQGRLTLIWAVAKNLDATCQTIVTLMEAGVPQVTIAEQLGVTTRTIRRKLKIIRDACNSAPCTSD